MKVFLIGSGNVAYHMVEAFDQASISISGLHARNKITGSQICEKYDIPFFSEMGKIETDADLYLVCVNDNAIQKVVKSIPKKIKEERIIAHTSGSRSMRSTLANCNLGGIFYPLQTFSKEKEMRYDDIPFCVNGKNDKIISKLEKLAKKISTNVHVIDDKQRKQIHLSAVLINNFVNHLIYKSEELLEAKDIPKSILQPLLLETIKKQSEIGAFEAQTGPARRDDTQTIESHLSLLDNKVDKKLYKLITQSISQTYK